MQDGESHDRQPRIAGSRSRPFCGPIQQLYNKKKKEKKKKNTFYIPQIFMHISQYTFIIILINTKKQHRDSKIKQ